MQSRKAIRSRRQTREMAHSRTFQTPLGIAALPAAPDAPSRRRSNDTHQFPEWPRFALIPIPVAARNQVKLLAWQWLTTTWKSVFTLLH